MRPTLTAVMVLLVLTSSVAKAGLIVNGGFETGDFTGWSVTGATVYGLDYGISTNTPHSGTYCAWFGAASGMTDLSQWIPTIPGDVYDASF